MSHILSMKEMFRKTSQRNPRKGKFWKEIQTSAGNHRRFLEWRQHWLLGITTSRALATTLGTNTRVSFYARTLTEYHFRHQIFDTLKTACRVIGSVSILTYPQTSHRFLEEKQPVWEEIQTWTTLSAKIQPHPSSPRGLSALQHETLRCWGGAKVCHKMTRIAGKYWKVAKH